MLDVQLETALRAFATERKYGDATLNRWLVLPAADAAALLHLARDLRLGENQLRGLWDWAQDVAVRDGRSIAQVLDSSIGAVGQGHLNRNDKLKHLKAALRRQRFPELAALEDQLAELVRQLALPPTVRVTLPEFLEGDELRVEIVTRSPAALHDAAARLLAASQTPLCTKLFDLLSEAP